MSSDDASPRTLRSPLARAAVLLSSGSLAALLVVRSGPGCGGGPDAPAPTPAAAPKAEAPKAEAPKAAAPTPAAQAEPSAAPQPAPSNVAEPPPAANPAPKKGEAKKGDGNVGPVYLPASKAGVFHEYNPNPAPDPPQQQAPQTPQQQAGPR